MSADGAPLATVASTQTPPHRRRSVTAWSSVVLLLALAGCQREPENPERIASDLPTFVGSQQCASCHATEFERWQDSHHALAMQVADDSTMLGDFAAPALPYFETQASFAKRDDRYYLATENADGVMEEFEITHTFGVAPLQQYLVDGPRGRKQALQFAWDARSTDEGGQRWFHLYAEEFIDANDPLHWTGDYFNWNYMCAECHSTNVRLGYDPVSDSFETTFDEISVGCEACHGPASDHINQANGEDFDEHFGLPVDLDDLNGAAWVMNASTGIAERSRPNSRKQQPEACGRCHSRRTVLTPDYEYGTPLTNTHMPALLEENLYYADGRIQDEVYVYGSFLQSRMYAIGVTCTDCHDPHSGQLHTGPDPNDICAGCHLAETFASTSHSANRVGDCVACHMPATTYMGVDDRRDHSFRLPNAGLAADHYGATIAAGRVGGANDRLLGGIANAGFPPIARATMLTLLDPLKDAAEAAPLLDQLESPEPLIRIAALRALRDQPPELRMQAGSQLLRDPVRGVRLEAVMTYTEYRDLLPLADARAYPAAAEEYREALRQAGHMPESLLRLADFENRSGNSGDAERLFERAIGLDPAFAPARHAYGLFLVRANRHGEALEQLAAAADLAPTTERFVYVYGVALNSLGQSNEAIDVLSNARARFPDSFDIDWALATVLRDRQDLRWRARDRQRSCGKVPAGRPCDRLGPVTRRIARIAPGGSKGEPVDLVQCVDQGIGYEGRSFRACVGTHQADAPRVAGKFPETATKLDIPVPQQAAAHRRIVHALGHPDQRQRRQAARGIDNQFQPGLLQQPVQYLCGRGVSLPSCGQRFLCNQAQRFVHRIERIDRRRVMIGARFFTAFVVFHQQANVAEPALHFGLARLYFLEGGCGKRNGRQPGHAGQAFLAARIRDIDSPIVDAQRNAAERGDTVCNGQATVLPRHGGDSFGVRADTGARLGVDERDGRHVIVLLKQFRQCLGIDGGAPFELKRNDVGAGTLANVLHAAAKHAVDADHDLVTRFKHVDKARLHTDGAWRGQHERQGIARLKSAFQALSNLVHDRQESRIKVTDRRPGQRPENIVRHVRRAGTEQFPANGRCHCFSPGVCR